MLLYLKYLLLILITLSGFYSTLNGQEYDSIYTASNGTKGRASFEYYYDLDHLMVKNGHFKFKTDSLDSIPSSVIHETFIEGDYSENKKTKNWLYELTRREIDLLSIEDDRLVYNLNTFRTSIEGDYERGLPSGEWHVSTTLINEKGEQKEVEKTILTFRRGYAHGEFHHRNNINGDNLIEITGQFDQGTFIGEWKFNYFQGDQKITEIRNYDRGVLISSSINGEVISFPLSPKTEAAIAGTEKGNLISPPTSIDFNDGYPTGSIYITSQEAGNNFLRSIQNNLLQFDSDVLRKQKVIFGATKVQYPLTDEEQALVSKWREIESNFENEVNTVKEHEIRDFGSSKDSIAVISLDWIQKQEELIDQLSVLSQILLSGEAEYYYRDALLLENAIRILDADTLHYNESQYIVEYPTPIESRTSLLAYLVENYTARVNIAKRIDQFLSELQTTASLEDELASLPELIKQEQAAVDSIYALEHSDATTDLLTQVSSKFIKQQVEDAQSQFEEMEESESKKALGDSILITLNTLKRIHQEAIRIESRAVFVDSLYTEYMFDAFTFSDIEARVKKRLYDEVIDIQKELTSDAIRASSPKQCLALLDEVYRTQGALIFLRDRKTRPLERNLAKANDLSEKLALLNEVF